MLARWMMASVFIVLGGWRLWGVVQGVPTPNAALVISAGELALGVVIATGWRLRWTALAAGALLCVDALVSHPFWTLAGNARDGQLLHFMKNLGLVGGFLLLSLSANRRR